MFVFFFEFHLFGAVAVVVVASGVVDPLVLLVVRFFSFSFSLSSCSRSSSHCSCSSSSSSCGGGGCLSCCKWLLWLWLFSHNVQNTSRRLFFVVLCSDLPSK